MNVMSRPTSHDYWLSQGLSVRTANILVNLGCTTRDQVQLIGSDYLRRNGRPYGIGQDSYNEIAALMGWSSSIHFRQSHSWTHFVREPRPEYQSWLKYGFPARTANFLIEIGCMTFDDLERMGVEEFQRRAQGRLARASFNTIAILLNWPLEKAPSRPPEISEACEKWIAHGLTVRAANVLINLGYKSVDDIRDIGTGFLHRGQAFGMGRTTYNEIAKLMNWPMIRSSAKPQSNALIRAWQAQGVSMRTAVFLVNLGCRTRDDIRQRIQPDKNSWMGRTTYNEIAGLMGWPYEKSRRVSSSSKKSNMPTSGLEFTFVCPSEWVATSSAMMRLKIESGIVFCKPGGGKSTGFQDMPITSMSGIHCTATMLAGNAFIARVVTLLGAAGWSNEKPYFRLLEAQRGWYQIIPQPSSELPQTTDAEAPDPMACVRIIDRRDDQETI